jgi:alcohol dehydrogenase
MIPFDYESRTRVVFGPGAIQRLGELARELGARRALVVSDPGVMSAGHTDRGVTALAAAGIGVQVFGRVRENPTTDDVQHGLDAARDWQPDLLVGLGGGSSLDCAKGVNFLYTNGGRMQDYWGVGQARQPMLPMIAVPTTAGTGSEAQSFALISDPVTKAKMACGDKKAACRVAILDPQLTLTQPPRVTALTGMDAAAHALETYVSKRRNSLSQMFSREAWRLLAGNFAEVLAHPDNRSARAAMQLGAHYAGAAIENSMLGAAHALANPLTAHYGIAHGEAVGLMLPHVVRYNAEVHADWYDELVRSTWMPSSALQCDPVPALCEFLEQLLGRAGLATRLSQCGVSEERLPELAEAAAQQWTGTFNPRAVGPAELECLYRCAL